MKELVKAARIEVVTDMSINAGYVYVINAYRFTDGASSIMDAINRWHSTGDPNDDIVRIFCGRKYFPSLHEDNKYQDIKVHPIAICPPQLFQHIFDILKVLITENPEIPFKSAGSLDMFQDPPVPIIKNHALGEWIEFCHKHSN